MSNRRGGTKQVVFLNPPVWPYAGVHLNFNPNLGTLYLAATVRSEYHTRVFDCEALRWNYQEVLDRLKQIQPYAVGITATTLGFPSMQRLTREIRKTLPKTYVMIGGPHVTAHKEAALEATSAHVAVVGEGEPVILDLLHRLPKGVVENRDPLDLGGLPRPAWDLLNPKINSLSYAGNAPRYDLPETAVQWQRGCPHGCSFCSHAVFGNRPTKFRPAQSIVDELRHLRDHWGIRTVFVYDDEMFGLSEKQNQWLDGVLDRIIEAKLGLNLKTQGRCNERLVRREILEKMAEAGFRSVMLGCESGSPKVLQANHKGTTVEDIRHTVRLVAEAGMDPWTFWMVGNLEETPEDASMTEDLLRELNTWIRFRQVTICTPWSGSKTYEIAKREGWIFSEDVRDFLADRPVMNTPWMSAQEMVEWRRRLLNA